MVARILDALPAGWLILHSVPVGESGTDIDHVVVSPGGTVITINTKHHPGKRVWVGGDAVYVNGNPTRYVPSSRSEAARAIDRLREAIGRAVTVRAFLVFVGVRRMSIRQLPADVTVATAGTLIGLLHAAGSGGTPEQGNAVKRAAVSADTWSSTRFDPALSANLLNWFLSVREALRVPIGGLAPRPGERYPLSHAGRSHPGPSRSGQRWRTLQVLGIIFGAVVGSFWALGMILELLSELAAHA